MILYSFMKRLEDKDDIKLQIEFLGKNYITVYYKAKMLISQ
jgi:hypothetical protein